MFLLRDLPGLRSVLSLVSIVLWGVLGSCGSWKGPELGSPEPRKITVMASDEVDYERVVDVMNACAGAGIKDVTFGTGSG